MPVGSTHRFPGKRESIDGRHEVYERTENRTLGVHVSRIEQQNVALLTCTGKDNA